MHVGKYFEKWWERNLLDIIFVSTALSDSSWKHITSRVKESEAKRRRRKENQYQHSLSEPSTGVHRHKFRYNFKQSYEDLTELDSPEGKGMVNYVVLTSYKPGH